jgi:sugar phosphate permease
MMINNDLAQKATRWEVTTLGCMFIGYMGFILTRTVLAVASPEMVGDPNLRLDEAGYGDIAAWGMAGMIAVVATLITTWFAFEDYRRFQPRAGKVPV